mgnify:CR=1 FL=1
MKIKQTVTFTSDEVNKLVTKYVEKKLGKKVTSANMSSNGDYDLELEEQTVDDKAAEKDA